jgi:hypothetical protein
MKLMTTVQQEINSCGIAAVATIVQKPYSKLLAVANSLGIFASDEWLFSNTEYRRRLLKQYSVHLANVELIRQSY